MVLGLGTILLIGTLPTFLPAGDAPNRIRWRDSYGKAHKEAVACGRPMLVQLGTPACTYCVQMESTTFHDRRVIEKLNGKFIPLRIDAQKSPQLAKAFAVTAYPTTLIVTPDLKVVGRYSGYQSAETLQSELTRADIAQVADSSTTEKAAEQN